MQSKPKSQLLKQLPGPLLEEFLAGGWLPILGAGMSRNAIVPKGKQIPLWSDLGDAFAADLDGYSAANPIDAISAFAHEYSRPKMVERLSELLLINEARPGPTHVAFCELGFDVVCTTNVDFVLDDGYKASSHVFVPVIEQEQLPIRGTNDATRLLKLHGDVHHPQRLVMTEEDYDLFLALYPMIATYLSSLLITRTAVFIGYSLDDPDFRHLWSIIGERLGPSRKTAYALMVGAGSTSVARFERRNVKVINLKGTRSNAGAVLAQLFEELRAYLGDNVTASNVVTEEDSLAELLLPSDSTNRLVFFSIPALLIAQYKRHIFPIVVEHGFVPLSPDDVVTPGGRVGAIYAIIERAQVVVVDLSSRTLTGARELGIARKKGKEVVVVAEEGRPMRISGSDIESLIPDGSIIVLHQGLSDLDADAVKMQFSAIFADLATRLLGSYRDEPSRLLAAGESRAALISAFGVLEEMLRRSAQERGERRITFSRLLGSSEALASVTAREREELRRLYRIRNEALHMNAPVTKPQAERAVRLIRDVLERLS